MADVQHQKAKKTRYFDYTLLFLIIFLCAFGLVMLYSVSSFEAQSKFGDAAFYLKRQLRAVVLGFIAMGITALIPYQFWKRVSLLAYGFAFLLCVAVLVVGEEYYGSQRWIYFHGIGFQPSEIAKVAVIIFLAALLSRMPKQVKNFKTVVKILVLLIPVIAPIAYTNLSTAIIIAGIAVIMLFVVSPKYSHFAALAGVGVIGIAAFIALAGYRSTRVSAWLHPEDYADDVYQTVQGLYALGSGGLFGKGLGESLQKLNYVPEAQNDFIFTIIGEELGIFGCVGVIALFVLLIWRLLVIANNAKNLFGSMLAVGVMAHIMLQVILNIAVVTNTIPNTGITLPFISYGGTSVMILLAEMGIVLNVSRSIALDLEPQTQTGGAVHG